LRLLVLGVAGLFLAGCSTSLVSPSSVGSPSGQPSASATPSVTPSASSEASAPAESPAVISDEALLKFAPPPGDGISLSYDPDTTDDVAADPRLAPDVSALAIGLFTVIGQSPPEDFVVASVARLRDPSADEAWFRGWRDSYDESACATAGGVAGHAESVINGRSVFIGTCKAGAITYHVRLAGGSIVLSMTSIGPARLGERVLNRLPA
jgi:hypothetical protein